MSKPLPRRALLLLALLALMLVACGGGERGAPTSAPASDASAAEATQPSPPRATKPPAPQATEAAAPRATEAGIPEAMQTLVAEAATPAAEAPAAEEATATPAAREAAPLAEEAIAYVRGDTADEIRLVAPDGSDDRALWAHGLDDPGEVYWASMLDWRPDGRELTFVSSHEGWCSLNSADLYGVAPDGSGYRRITQGAACEQLNAYPSGTVRVPVRNSSILGETFAGFVYFQGAPSLQPVSLAPGGSGMVTFENVADFGDGFLQVAVMIYGDNREVSIGTAVDVLPGGTVETAMMDLYPPSAFWEAHSATWRSDGSQIGYVLNFNSLLALPPQPEPFDLGSGILEAEWADLPDFVDFLKWGPPTRPSELLYAGNVAFDSEGIYLVSEGSAGGGERLLEFPTWENVMGLDWLPDGSGFVYSVIEDNDSYEPGSANLYLYRFESGTAERITELDGEFAGMLSVSPDGERIVFERGAALTDFNSGVAAPDLWIVNLDGSGLTRLVENGRAPAWGGAP